MKRIMIPIVMIVTMVSFTRMVEARVHKIDNERLGISKVVIDSVDKDKRCLDDYYSDKRLGSYVENNTTVFRLFAPSAEEVTLCIFEHPESIINLEYKMEKDIDGVWEFAAKGDLSGYYYGYKVINSSCKKEDSVAICIDPYSKAVTTYNDYFNQSRSIVVGESKYDWEGDNGVRRDWRDAIIYEMHVRDMTASSTSGAKEPGTYQGLVEKGIKGGIDYIKNLGVNTVELLPSQEFGNYEAPYKQRVGTLYNTWNSYGRNHWGYMTSAYFAPESYYSEPTMEKFKWIGKSGKQVNDFKDMVKAFHKENIAVVMDVVYNHLSEYEVGNLKQIDKDYYFRLDDKGNFRSESGCGNDLKTERKMVRKLIIESLVHWMQEYHVDGFRFDLGKLIDWETVEKIAIELKRINPSVIIVCEPWGGGYDPAGFSVRGWGAWNDQIRNGVKGENPFNGQGWIFGKWYGNNNINRIKSYVLGTLVNDKYDKNGLFKVKEHSVNYFESHDGYTLGDFIRIGLRDVNSAKPVQSIEANAKLSAGQIKLHKLAALFLMTSQGITMLHEGQEFGRSKVIPADVPEPDTCRGMIDGNSYNKDNATNYINYNHAEMNSELVNYYKGVIELRNKYAAFRRANYDDIKFIEVKDNEFALGYTISYEDNEYLVLFNADDTKGASFSLPAGEWRQLVSPDSVDLNSVEKISGKKEVGCKEGWVFIKVK